MKDEWTDFIGEGHFTVGKDVCKDTAAGNSAWQSNGFGLLGVVHDGKRDLDLILLVDHKGPPWL